jgi:hypothetical protein
MWPFGKNKKTQKNDDQNGQFVWLPVGAGNPFDAPIMDIRARTLNVVAATGDKSVAENFVRSRKSNGSEFTGKSPDSPVSVKTEITYPHNGARPEGIVFKSPAMEVKWDIYAYGECFYFVRSWTSDLIYKVKFRNTGSSLVLTEITAKDEATDETAQDIHSMMLTHALGRVWPYHLPNRLQTLDGKGIAVYMFTHYGSKATSVTKENVMTIQLINR